MSKSKQKSKFFRVAKAGATTDGRAILKEWIEQMARNYDPAKYTARISIEHIKGLHPNSDFRNFGDVLALKTEEKDGDLYLLAQIQPTAELIEYTQKGQKNFTSIEVNPNFADTGEAYLVGLAVTDNPASLGTEYLQFCAKNHTENQLTKRKADPQNLIAEALEFTLQFEGFNDIEALPDGNLALVQLNHKIANLQMENTLFKAELERLKARVEVIANQPEIGFVQRPEITGSVISEFNGNGYF